MGLTDSFCRIADLDLKMSVLTVAYANTNELCLRDYGTFIAAIWQLSDDRVADLNIGASVHNENGFSGEHRFIGTNNLTRLLFYERFFLK